MLYLTSIHQCFAVLQCQPYYKFSALPTVKWSCWEICPDCEKLVLQSQRRRQRFLQAFDDLLHSTPLTGIMKSPMQILQGRNARSDLSMSNAARKQLGIQPEVVRNNDKHAVLPTHDLHVGQDVIYQDSMKQALVPSCNPKFVFWTKKLQDPYKRWYCLQKTQSHLKPFTPQNKNFNLLSVCHCPMAQSTNMLPVRQTECKKSSTVNNHVQVQTSRPKRDSKPPSQAWSFKYFNLLNTYWIYMVFYSVYMYMQVSMQWNTSCWKLYMYMYDV